MRKFLLVAAAASTLSACNLLGVARQEDGGSGNKAAEVAGNSSEGTTDNGSEGANTAEPTENASRQPQQAASDNEWLIGRWGDESCQQTLEFAGNGDFHTAEGTGRWTLNGTLLTIIAGDSERAIEVERLEGGNLVFNDPETGAVELSRC